MSPSSASARPRAERRLRPSLRAALAAGALAALVAALAFDDGLAPRDFHLFPRAALLLLAFALLLPAALAMVRLGLGRRWVGLVAGGSVGLAGSGFLLFYAAAAIAVALLGLRGENAVAAVVPGAAAALLGSPLVVFLALRRWLGGREVAPGAEAGALTLESVSWLLLVIVAWSAPGPAGWRGEAALSRAARHGPPERVVALLAAGADPNRATADGLTPLHAAFAGCPRRFQPAPGVERVVQALLEAGADPTIPDPLGRRPLDLALNAVAPGPLVAQLIAHGADPNTPGQLGPPLHLAAERGLDGVVDTLLGAGARLDGRDANGRTPLMRLAERRDYGTSGRAGLARHLIAKGAAVDLEDAEGRTALHWAALACQVELSQILLAAGAPKGAADNHGRRPYDLAAANRRTIAGELSGFVETDCLALRPMLAPAEPQAAEPTQP